HAMAIRGGAYLLEGLDQRGPLFRSADQGEGGRQNDRWRGRRRRYPRHTFVAPAWQCRHFGWWGRRSVLPNRRRQLAGLRQRRDAQFLLQDLHTLAVLAQRRGALACPR